MIQIPEYQRSDNAMNNGATKYPTVQINSTIQHLVLDVILLHFNKVSFLQSNNFAIKVSENYISNLAPFADNVPPLIF